MCAAWVNNDDRPAENYESPASLEKEEEAGTAEHDTDRPENFSVRRTWIVL